MKKRLLLFITASIILGKTCTAAANEISVSPEELAYKNIIGKYARAIQDDDFLKYSTLNILSLNFRESQNGVIQYSFYDIDNNGTSELLLQLNKKNCKNTTKVMDLYTFDGERAVKFFQNEAFNLDTLAERSSLHIYDDGEMYIYGSSGAAYGSASFYKISDDGYTCILIEDYDVNHYDFPETPFRSETNQFSTEEFQALLKDRKEITDFTWYDIQENDVLFESGFELMEFQNETSGTLTETDLTDSQLYELTQTYFHSVDVLNELIYKFSLDYNYQELDALIDVEKISPYIIRVKFFDHDKTQCENIRDEILNIYMDYLIGHDIDTSILTKYIN